MLRFALLACASLDAVASAQARPLEDAIAVVPEDDCITAAALAGHVGVLRGSGELDETIAIEVSVAGAADVTFVVRRGGRETAQRAFDVLPLDCGARLGALALALALAIDHTLLEAEPEPEPEPPPPPPPPPIERAPWLALEADAVLLLATLHEAAFGGALAIEVLLDPIVSLRLRALAAYAPSATIEVWHFESVLAAAQLSGCVAWRDERIALGGCAGASVGLFYASGSDFARNLESVGPWVGLALEAFLAVTIADPVAIRLALGGDVSLLVPTVTVVNTAGAVTARASASPVGATISVGVVFSLR